MGTHKNPEKPKSVIAQHIEDWQKKKVRHKGETTEWNFNLDATGRALYDKNGKLSKHKRKGIIQAKTGWDPLEKRVKRIKYF